MTASAPAIIVPLDGTRHSLAALPVARTLAEILGEPLHVLDVTGRRLPPEDLFEVLGLAPGDLHGSVLDLVAGEPAAGIVEAARTRQAGMIVLCSNTGLPVPDQPLGHIAERVALDSTGPVVLVPPTRGSVPWRLANVLLPHDGTPTTAAAIGPAVDLAARAGARLTVVHIAVPGAPSETGTMSVPRYMDQPQHEWPRWAAEFLERLCCGLQLEPGKLRLVLGRGEPGAEIVRVATETSADLVVLGWKGCLEPARAVTLKAVLSLAQCPVMVLRVPDRR